LHHVDSIPIDYNEELFVKAETKHKGTEGLFLAYFNSQYVMMTTLKPTIIGHFDLIRIYRQDFELSEEVWTAIKRNIDFGISYGALFEFNSSAIKYGYTTPYPFPPIVRYIKEKGGKFTFGDDSHNPEFVGRYYDNLYKYIKEEKIEEIYYLERDNVTGLISKKKYEGDILQHPFWEKNKAL
jgi:histidinol-phosphatase (PHP family)